MYTLTVATHEEGYLDALKQSCKRFGYDLKVLGWQQPWQGFRWRMQLVVDELKKLPRDEIVMFVDAFDVVMTGPADEARRVFLETKAPMVVSAQREHLGIMGWAQKRSFETSSHLQGGHKCANTNCKSPFTLICAGTFIAYAGYAADLLDRCLEDGSDCKDDQVLMNRVWNDAMKNNNGKPPFKIDCGRELFNVHLPNIFSLHPRSIYASDNATFSSDGRVVVQNGKKEATRPTVTHFSGGIMAAKEIAQLGYTVKPDQTLKRYDVDKAWYHIKNSLKSKPAESDILGDNRVRGTQNTTQTLSILFASVCISLIIGLVIILRNIYIVSNKHGTTKQTFNNANIPERSVTKNNSTGK